MATEDTVIDFLQSHADSAMRTARETTSRIQNGSVVPLQSIALDYEAKAPNLPEPPKFSDLFSGADSTAAEVQRLDGEVDKLIDQFFPEISGALREAPEQWAAKIITGSDPFGDGKAVLDLLWHEARDRAYRAASTEQQTINATYSERGFTMPPGVMLRAGIEAEQRASQAIADINRAQTGRMMELKADLMKFAEEQAVRMKLGIMDALRSFYVSWVALPDKDIERERIRAQAQAALYGSLSSYYNVQVAFEQLRLRAAESDVQAALGVDRNKIAAFSSNQSASSLAQVVRGFTDVSSASANAQSALFTKITTE